MYICVSTSISCTNSTTPHDSSNTVATKVRVFIGFVYIKKFLLLLSLLLPLPLLLPPLPYYRCHCHCCQSKFALLLSLLLPSYHQHFCRIVRCRKSKPSSQHHCRCHIVATVSAAAATPSQVFPPPPCVVAAVLPLLPRHATPRQVRSTTVTAKVIVLLGLI